MKTHKTSVALVLTFGLWLGLILGCSSLQKGMNTKRVEREGPTITISAADFVQGIRIE